MPSTFCTFLLGDHLFGVDVHHVQEVIRRAEVTRVPLAPPIVAGVTSLRGQIVTVVEGRRLLALEDRDEDMIPAHLVLKTPKGMVSLLVDAVGDVLTPPEQSFEGLPEHVQPRIRDLLQGVSKLDNTLLLLIDSKRMLAML
jgi:purine-binding chemotaxis protein CheW